jgi:hypothetical protein
VREIGCINIRLYCKNGHFGVWAVPRSGRMTESIAGTHTLDRIASIASWTLGWATSPYWKPAVQKRSAETIVSGSAIIVPRKHLYARCLRSALLRLLKKMRLPLIALRIFRKCYQALSVRYLGLVVHRSISLRSGNQLTPGDTGSIYRTMSSVRNNFSSSSRLGCNQDMPFIHNHKKTSQI